MSNKSNVKRGTDSQQRVVSRRRKPQLYEISALVSYHAVILATSREDALEEVATWENAWHDTADLVGVSDVDVFDVRELQATDWEDEAHCRTRKAANDRTERRGPATLENQKPL